jgi:hypothetical protein
MEAKMDSQPRSAGAPGRADGEAGTPRRGLAGGYLRLAGVIRGPADVVVTVAVFAAALAVGGRAGVAAASGWMLVSGVYCVLNFWHCRETHCVVTGAGWTSLGLLGLAAALVPGASLSWYRAGAAAAAYLVITAAGYSLQRVVAARTGRRTLGGGRCHAQAR